MKEKNIVCGVSGEINACQYLKDKKYIIEKTNFKTNVGEIDIVARKGRTIVFVEVKKRETLVYGRPSEAVDQRKQNKIRNTAQLYLLKNKLASSPVRFDVIELIGDKINHIENAF